jgi:hypothetical protein
VNEVDGPAGDKEDDRQFDEEPPLDSVSHGRGHPVGVRVVRRESLGQRDSPGAIAMIPPGEM